MKSSHHTVINQRLTRFLISSENSNDDEASETRGLGVYAQNIDLHLHAEDGTETPGALNLDGHSNNAFFQPEPALLDIADGTNSSNLPQEIVASDNTFYRINQVLICQILPNLSLGKLLM